MLRSDIESGFAFTVDCVRDNLDTFAKLCGGRMHGSFPSHFQVWTVGDGPYASGCLQLAAPCKRLALRSRWL